MKYTFGNVAKSPSPQYGGRLAIAISHFPDSKEKSTVREDISLQDGSIAV